MGCIFGNQREHVGAVKDATCGFGAREWRKIQNECTSMKSYSLTRDNTSSHSNHNTIGLAQVETRIFRVLKEQAPIVR